MLNNLHKAFKGNGGIGVGGNGGVGGTFNGGNGASGYKRNSQYPAIYDHGGGGGSSGGVSRHGINANFFTGGAAVEGGGAGGNGNSNFGNGLPGIAPGGGGGGACRTNTPISSAYGGNGADGQVVISWQTCSPPTINAEGQPVNQIISYGSDVSFSAVASGQGSLAYQWEVKTPYNPTWAAVTNDDVYSGATNGTLTLRKPPASLSGNKYRCKVAGCDPLQTTFSVEASLQVRKAGAIVSLSDLKYTYAPLTPRAATITTFPPG